METMRRRTRDLPMFKRLIAKLIHKAQKYLIVKENVLAFKLYYVLAKMHFKLHYGFELSDAIKTIGKSKTSTLSAKRAALRHANMFFSANPDLLQEGKKTITYYRKSAVNAFLNNIVR